MTGDELIAALQGLPPEKRGLPVVLEYYTYGDEYEGTRTEDVVSVSVSEKWLTGEAIVLR
jgi:hypothetical protein